MTKHLTLPRIATLCAIALSVVVGVRLANAAAGDIYNLGTLGGIYSSHAYDINDAGQVVGSVEYASGWQRAFLWDSNRGMTDLGTPEGHLMSWGYAINASGTVVGVSSVDDPIYGNWLTHAFAWTPNLPNGTTGTMTNPANLASGNHSTAVDINSAGQVVGSSTYAYFDDEGCTPDAPYYPNCGGTWVSDHGPSAALWENGVGTVLIDRGVATAINNAGQVVGSSTDGHAYRYDSAPGSGGIIHDLGTLGGTLFSHAYDINDSGQVVGDSYSAGNGQHAFLYNGTPGSGGVMVDLGTLGGTSYSHSHAYGINDAGFVVGEADRAAGAGGGAWATLWLNDAGNTAIDLDAWLDAINPTLGAYWYLMVARAINNNGLITGTGIYNDGPGGLSDGSRAFVLDASSLMSVIPGDFNGNGVVDAADYVVWRKGTSIAPTQENYNIWRSHFGQTAPNNGSGASSSGNSSVPEPATCALLMFAVIGWCLRRGQSS